MRRVRIEMADCRDACFRESANNRFDQLCRRVACVTRCPDQTDCRHRPIRNVRSIAVIHISILTVSNVASISIDRGTVPGHLQNYRRKPPPLSICTTRNAHIRPHRACKTGPRRKWAKKKAIIPARERWPGGFKIIGTPLRDKLLQLREEQSHAKSPAWACFHVDS